MPTATLRDPKVNGGRPTEIEFSTEGDGSGPSYSPRFGADSGDPLITIIEEAFDVEMEMTIELTQEEDEHAAETICANYEFDDDQSWELDL